MDYFSNILLIAGTGRNAGKTSFVCSVIKKFKNKNTKIISVKISPNIHEIQDKNEIFISNKDFLLLETKNTNSKKDSSRMLKAGADKSFYIQSTDKHLNIVFEELKKCFNKNDAIIIESGGLINIIKPALFFIINKTGNTFIKPKKENIKESANKWIEFNGSEFDFNLDNLTFENNTWKLIK